KLAIAIFSFASLFNLEATDWRKLLATSLIAFLACTSDKGVAAILTYASMPCVNTSNPVVAVKNALFVIKVSGSTIAISGTSDFEMIVNFRSLLESNIMENCDTSDQIQLLLVPSLMEVMGH